MTRGQSRFLFGSKILPEAASNGFAGRQAAREALNVDRGEAVTIDRPSRRRFDPDADDGPVDLVTAMQRNDLCDGLDDLE